MLGVLPRLLLQFSTAGCANRIIALVGHRASECVLASDAVCVRVLLFFGKIPLGIMHSLVLVFRVAVIVIVLVEVVVVRFLDLELL